MGIVKKIKNEILSYNCRHNYTKILKRIEKISKIRVVFLVTENQKWGYQSLYDIFANNEFFEPLVVVSILEGVHKGKDTTRNNLEENYNFFKSRGMSVDYAYKNGECMDLKEFMPDILFYEQPWGLPKIHKPQNVSKFALTCYCPYSFDLFDCKEHYKNNFHYFLWRYFVDNQLNIERFKTYSAKNIRNCQAFGYPKLDVYVNQDSIKQDFWGNSDKTRIIYAPHHSIEKNSLKLATFLDNGKFILDYAKKHTENMTWIFKPHPQLKYALLKDKIMSEIEIEQYYKEWEELGRVYTKGNYFDIFKTSNLMITDCGSFLCEYLLTGNPIIQLVNKEHHCFNPLGEMITSYNYKAYSCEDIENILTEIITNNNDYNKEKRLALINEIIDIKETSASKICKYILKTCHRGDDD